MKKNYINGQWLDALNGQKRALINPATETVIDELPFGDKSDFILAADAAAKAFETWRKTTPYERAKILNKTAAIIRKNLEIFANDMVLESGKPLAEAKAEWTVAANLFEWFAEEGKRSYGRVIPSARANKRMQVIYQPIGVVGAITAWNFPAYNPARCWAAILAAGCTLVARSSEFTALTAFNLITALHEAGIPAGVANYVNGIAKDAGEVFIQHPAIRKISFTGSTRVGELLMNGASATHTRLALELGGNAPVIVCSDVDPAKTAKESVIGKFRNAGQVCIAPQRFYVHESIVESFLTHAKAAIEQLVVGNGLEATTQVGPLINDKQKQHVLHFINKAEKEGASIVTGGTNWGNKGHFITPCLIKASAQQQFLKEEVFGPVMIVVPFSTNEEALHLANDTPYGLAAYVCTNNLQWAYYFSEQLEAGLIGVNEWLPQATEAPFGGWKASGIGHESGAEGLLEYMDKKLISIGSL